MYHLNEAARNEAAAGRPAEGGAHLHGGAVRVHLGGFQARVLEREARRGHGELPVPVEPLHAVAVGRIGDQALGERHAEARHARVAATETL